MKKSISNLLNKRAEAIGVIEIILILVVLIGLALIFREQLTAIVNNVFKYITDKTGSFLK